MNALQIELTKLIGSKELTFGCKVKIKCFEKGRNKNGGSELIEKGISDGYMTSDKDYAHINGFQRVYIEVPDDNSSSFDMSDFGDEFYELIEIIGHPATLSDLHIWMNEKGLFFQQKNEELLIDLSSSVGVEYDYNSSKELLDQDESVLKQIIELVKANSSL